MHLPFDNVRYSPHASRNVSYFFVADMKCGLYQINKNNRAKLNVDQVCPKKCAKTELKRCWTGEVMTRTWSCTNTTDLLCMWLRCCYLVTLEVVGWLTGAGNQSQISSWWHSRSPSNCLRHRNEKSPQHTFADQRGPSWVGRQTHHKTATDRIVPTKTNIENGICVGIVAICVHVTIFYDLNSGCMVRAGQGPDFQKILGQT